MTVHDFTARTITGEDKNLADYAGSVLLIVNTASKCGFTPQYRELQELYDKYHDKGFEILGFPSNQFGNQEPGNEEEIREFCRLNHGVSFPMFSKTKVKGKEAHELFRYLTREAPGIMWEGIKWNFTKFLVDQKGNVVKRCAPQTKPFQLERDIEKLLAK
ncbi:glutathione peroxidase [Melghirimyces profundicolus]|uniref:glutathione peroxidase n=1 Tax=Melghirimyces profundicolus TaxID=1242148 RepID=UPI000D3A817E|nr:glutathione peroxidase [Melghirimyces profundicolus]